MRQDRHSVTLSPDPGQLQVNPVLNPPEACQRGWDSAFAPPDG
jgi:hypothetical protein